jgi:HAD superfamily hydrolase (TIGR01490 family)
MSGRHDDPVRTLARFSTSPGGASGSRWSPAHIGHDVALFDLDRTLIRGSSLSLFGRELVRQGLVPRSMVARHALSELAFQRRGLGAARIDRLVTTLLQAAAGTPAEPIGEVARSMGPRLLAQVPAAARFLLERHIIAGDFCVILSASPHELVEALTSALGAHRAVGTRVEVRDGLLTGRLDGPFCYGTGKLEGLEREVGRIDLSAATAYADSGSDLPLLERCGTAVAVNPDAELRRWAARAGWPVVRFS